MAKTRTLSHREQLMQRAGKLINLALVYAEDGAWTSAAMALRDAAKEFDLERERVNKLIQECLVKEGE